MENHRTSRIKKMRKSGFRKRMQTHNGRKTVSNKRRLKRRVNVR